MIADGGDYPVPVLKFNDQQAVMCQKNQVNFAVAMYLVHHFETSITVPSFTEFRSIEGIAHALNRVLLGSPNSVTADVFDLHV